MKIGSQFLNGAALRPFFKAEAAQLLLASIAALALLFYRRPGLFLSPQLYVEDGYVLFQDSVANGPASILFKSSGYYILYQRLIAAAALNFSYEAAPSAFAAGTFCALLLFLLVLFSPRIDLPYKPLFAAAPLLIPSKLEPFIGLINSQWILALVLILLIVSDGPRSAVGWTSDLSLIVVAGLSGPFSLLLAPLFAARALLRRERYTVITFILISAMAWIQAREGAAPRAAGSAADWLQLVHLHSFLSGQFFFGNLVTVPPEFSWPILLLALTGTALPLAIFLFAAKKQLVAPLVFVSAAVLIYLSVLAAFYATPHVLIGGGFRYRFIPMTALFWSLLSLLPAAPRSAGIALALLFLNTTVNREDFRGPRFKYYQWEKKCACIGRLSRCRIDIAPDGWYIEFTPDRPARYGFHR